MAVGSAGSKSLRLQIDCDQRLSVAGRRRPRGTRMEWRKEKVVGHSSCFRVA